MPVQPIPNEISLGGGNTEKLFAQLLQSEIDFIGIEEEGFDHGAEHALWIGHLHTEELFGNVEIEFSVVEEQRTIAAPGFGQLLLGFAFRAVVLPTFVPPTEVLRLLARYPDTYPDRCRRIVRSRFDALRFKVNCDGS